MPPTAPTETQPAPGVTNAEAEKPVMVQLPGSLTFKFHVLFKSYILSVECKENKAQERFNWLLFVPAGPD